MVITNKQICEMIKSELELFADELEYDFNFYVENEQLFEEPAQIEEKDIYVVIAFGKTSVNLGQKVLPITIQVLSEGNSNDDVQNFLNAWTEEYNLQFDTSGKIRQIYTTPTVSTNFEEVGRFFRSLFTISSSLIISENINPYDLYVTNNNGDLIKIEFLASQCDTTITPDTQAYSLENNFTKSVNKFGTRTLSFSMYEEDNDFVNTILDIIHGDVHVVTDDSGIVEETNINTTFTLTKIYKNGKQYTHQWKLVDASETVELVNLPLISLTFTN